MSLSWFLVAARSTGVTHRGLLSDASALVATGSSVELLVAGDAVIELLAAAHSTSPLDFAGVRVLVDGHSHRRRGSPPLPPECSLVEPDHAVRRFLDPRWKVVWR